MSKKKEKITEEEQKEIKQLNDQINGLQKALENAQQQITMKKGAYNHVMEKIIDKYDVDTDKETLNFETGEIEKT